MLYNIDTFIRNREDDNIPKCSFSQLSVAGESVGRTKIPNLGEEQGGAYNRKSECGRTLHSFHNCTNRKTLNFVPAGEVPMTEKMGCSHNPWQGLPKKRLGGNHQSF